MAEEGKKCCCGDAALVGLEEAEEDAAAAAAAEDEARGGRVRDRKRGRRRWQAAWPDVGSEGSRGHRHARVDAPAVLA